jgi:cyclase
MSVIRFALSLTFSSVFLTAANAAEQDFDSVEITATPAGGAVTMLQGSGGNIAVSIGDDGVLMVDDQFAPLAGKIKTAIRALGGDLPTYLINTHWHGDHSGGNEEFSDSATIIAHNNVRVRMSDPANERVPQSWPVITYGNDLAVHFNGEEIRLIYLPDGHTDGDTAIWFTRSGVIHMGDAYVTEGFPFVDLNSGGTVDGLVRNHEELLAALPDDIVIIPGHGNLATKAQMAAWIGMVRMTAALVTEQMTAGKSLTDIVAAGLPAEYERWGRGFISEEDWITAVYNDTQGN